MKVALVSEGTYPYAMGGVSVWCDQLIRGLPDYRWEIVALTVDNTERAVWPAPDNLDRVTGIPLWGTDSGRRRGGRPGATFRSAYEMFLDCLLNPLDSGTDREVVDRSRFLLALSGLHEYAQSGRLASALISNDALTSMMDAWHSIRANEPSALGPSPGLTLGHAAEAAGLIEHMLRPLSAPPVRADVIHSSMNGLSMLVAMAAKWSHGTPVLLSEHGIYLRERYIAYLREDAPHPVKVLVLSFIRSLAGAAYLISDALAPHSSYNRRWQLRNGADPQRMWTMYNGVSPDDFPLATAEPADPTIVFMGRIDPLKDVHTLIRAFAVVRERVPNARLRIYGGTPAINRAYRESCVTLVEELGVVDTATFEGRVDNPVDAYHAGSVVALTSISEGFPYTVVEAMACGRTVVCTNVGGVSEAVADAGIVVPPRDVAGVADACVRLLTDDALRHRLAGLARERVMQQFTLQQSLNAYRELYERLTAPTGASTLPRPQPARARAVVARACGRAQVPESNRADAGDQPAVRDAVGRAAVVAVGRASLSASESSAPRMGAAAPVTDGCCTPPADGTEGAAALDLAEVGGGS
jgi:glycosyltransferase involved in cell wall biosynthesis